MKRTRNLGELWKRVLHSQNLWIEARTDSCLDNPSIFRIGIMRVLIINTTPSVDPPCVFCTAPSILSQPCCTQQATQYTPSATCPQGTVLCPFHQQLPLLPNIAHHRGTQPVVTLQLPLNMHEIQQHSTPGDTNPRSSREFTSSARPSWMARMPSWLTNDSMHQLRAPLLPGFSVTVRYCAKA